MHNGLKAETEMKPVTAKLMDALLAAQKQMKPIYKDGTNEYSKYKYTTAEQMLTECRKALNDNGLYVMRNGWSVPAPNMVTSEFNVNHADSNETHISTCHMPFYERKGTPLDKAMAAALTTTFSYFLRDLLCVPRTDELDALNDVPPDPPKRKAAPQKVEIYNGTEDQRDRLVKYVEKKMISSDLWDTIDQKLNGRPITDIEKVIGELGA